MNETDIQTIQADFSANENLNISLQSEPYTSAEFGTVYVVENDNRVLYATTETWNSQPSLVARKGFIYIYSDWKTDTVGNPLAGIKIGDGNAYLIDMPFLDDMYYAHINDAIVHITKEEREFWNNKVRCYMAEDNTNLIFTTN